MHNIRRLYKIPLYGRQLCRRYSSKPVGKKFTTIDEIKEYMSEETWSIQEYLASGEVKKEDLPSKNDVVKLLKLSGLPVNEMEIQDIQKRLGKQLSFINKLHRIPLKDESVDAMDARIAPRNGMQLGYNELLSQIETQRKNADTGEVDDSWDSTGLAKIKKDGFFVVRGGQMTNRN